MEPNRPQKSAPGVRWLRDSAFLLLGLTGLFWPGTADAQMLVKVGSFLAPAATGTQPITGVGFAPQAVIFFWTAQTTTGFATNAAVGYGFATATAGSARAVNFASDNGLDATNPARWQSLTSPPNNGHRCIVVVASAAAAATDAEARLNSMDLDGFTVNWTKVSGSAWIIHYLALGGSDITNAAVGSFTPAAGPGSEPVTGVGFQPEFLMFLSIDSNSEGSRVTPDGKLSIGYAGLSNTYGITQGADTVNSRTIVATANIITDNMQRTDRAILEKDTGVGSGNVTLEAAVTSFDVDGFTINKTVNTAAGTIVHFLALRGGQYRVGEIRRPLVAGPQTVAYTGVGFVPRGLLFQSYNLVDQTVPDEEARLSVSAADTTVTGGVFTPNQRATFFHDKIDAPSDSDLSWVRQGTSGSAGVNGKVVYLAQAGDCPPRWAPEPGGAPPASPNSIQCSAGPRLISDADVATYNIDGFTLNWTTNDLANMNQNTGDEMNAQVLYVAFGAYNATAVELASFTARGEDSAVALEWETASELDNLGFHVHRARSEAGPYERITESLIPGLGSSPTGARYSYRDTGLINGVTYYYKLDDVETTGRTKLHGPVTATPVAAAAGGGSGEGSETRGGGAGSGGSTRITYGDPEAVSLRVVRRGAGGVELELVTRGFYATPEADGSVRLEIPGFEVAGAPGMPAIPVERALLEAVAGRRVRIAGVAAREVVGFTSLRPAAAEAPEIVVRRDGTVRAGRRRAQAAWQARGLYPEQAARVVSTAFQGEVKKALVELAPLRWDAASGQLLLARRLRVRLVFAGREKGETALGGSRGRAYRERREGRGRGGEPKLAAYLLARERGLYGVAFEQAFPGRRRAVLASELRLARQGQDVAFHLEPDPSRFGPGSRLFFLSEGGALSAYANEAVYELSSGTAGTQMPVVAAAPTGAALGYGVKREVWEQNRYYIAGLLEAPDLWLWDSLLSGTRKSYTLALSGVAVASEPATLGVWLQGASDFDAALDHRVRVYVNGSFVGEASWDGKAARRLSLPVLPGILREGENLLELENVGDTEAAYSMVYLDRISLDYPRTLAAEAGRFEAGFSFPGSATITGLGAGSVALDTTEAVSPRWLVGTLAGGASVSLGIEAGHRYLAVSPQAWLAPGIRWPAPSDLRSTRNQADYLLVAPREFLPAAAPLLQLRQQQGLRTRAVALEEIFDVFGYGERSAEAIRDFVAYAYHRWSSPSPRYVLLLGDATYDPKNYAGGAAKDRIPAYMFKSSYLWTATDPAFAAVNGDDDLPDLAVGRLSASSLEQAASLIEKLVAFEANGFDLSGPAVLVADNPDPAGDFERNADEIAAGLLAGHATEKIYLSRLGSAEPMRSAILAAFDRGASLMSYIGHGGTAVWASENVLNSWDAPKLAPQAQQPLLFTMNCLNGYFLPPVYDSLSETLVKAEGKGAVAAFSPSGLSLDDAAHLYHKALLGELVSGQHARLGDAILAAQSDYAATGAFPELLRIYNLLGDPALKLR